MFNDLICLQGKQCKTIHNVSCDTRSRGGASPPLSMWTEADVCALLELWAKGKENLTLLHPFFIVARTLSKWLEKKLNGNYTRMLRAILNKSWRQHPTRHQLYGHLPPITKTIQVRRTRHAGHCWRSRDELMSDALLWTPTHGRAKAGRPARTYIQQLCEDTGCCPEDLPEAMNDREEWRERVRDICTTSTTWWWWWWWWWWLEVVFGKQGM